MVGDYEMETRQGENFLVAVPAFSLDSPQQTTARASTSRTQAPPAPPRRPEKEIMP